MNKISFIANRPWLDNDSLSTPSPVSKVTPKWYKDADVFFKDETGQCPVDQHGSKFLTWKSCPALLDIFISGYVLKTPCDIEFYKNDFGQIDVKIENNMLQDFCIKRGPMPQFQNPNGYYEDHFAWQPDWAISLPDGYSALYINPMNRFDLPFLMTSGIIDNDKVNLPGSMPFFLIDGFTGIIPAGTPYAQIIPFKREDWESEYIFEDIEVMAQKNIENSKKYRVPNGGVYKNFIWSMRKYK